jgi:hypothetical protein
MNCPHQQWLKRTMVRLQHASTPVIYPAPNPQLMVLLLKIHKRKYKYTFYDLSKRLSLPYQTIANWFYGASMRKKTYYHVMNYLDNHS